MVRPSKRSRSLRRVYKKTPGGKNVVHHERRNPNKARCGNCGSVLAGVPSRRPSDMQNMARTKKRPSRPYGGVLCSKCMRLLQIAKARKND